MSIRKFELGDNWDLHYYDGEATEDDVIISEVETREHISKPEDDIQLGFIESTVHISLKKELRELFGYVDKEPTLRSDCPRGVRRLRVITRIEKVTDRNIKAMRTRHEKACEQEFNEKAKAEKVRQLLSNANWEVKDSRDKFVRQLAGSMKQVESWDNKPRLDELATVRSELQKKVKEIEKEMKDLMKGEIDEWLTEKECDPDIKGRILENAKFSYIPDVLIIN